MLCLTEVSPPKAPDGRTLLVDAITGTQYRTFRHGIVDDKAFNENFTGSTVSFAPNLGCGTVLCAQEQSILYNYSLAQSSPVLRCLMPEKITAQKISPCGNYIALGGVSGAVYYNSLLTGEMLWMKRGHVRAVTCLAFSTPTSSSGGGFHSASQFLASASVDTTCRIIKMGFSQNNNNNSSSNNSNSHQDNSGNNSSAPVVTMTGHSLAVTACAFMKYANRLVSVSRDRTCRISDALSGTVLRVFTASVPLMSVCVGPCDAVVACGGNNGSITFFKQLDNTLTNEEVLSSSSSSSSANAAASSSMVSTNKKNKLKNTSSVVKRVTSGAEISRDVSVLNLAGSSSSNNNNNNTNQQDFNNDDVSKVVGPFTGGAEGPILLLDNLCFMKTSTPGLVNRKDDIYFSQNTENIFGNGNSAAAVANDDDSPSATTVSFVTPEQQQQRRNFLYDVFQLSSNTQHEQPTLVAVSRDGFVQSFSWSTLSFIKDLQPRFKKGIAAVSLVPPRFIPFASSTLADKPLIQKSALLLKKAPVAAAGPRAFLMKALWKVNMSGSNSTKNNKEQDEQKKTSSSKEDGIVSSTTTLLAGGGENEKQTHSSTLFYRIRQRDESAKNEDDILERQAEWLNRLELQIMKQKEEELLLQANEAYENEEE